MSAKKFEKLIDLIINEDQERANQLFHEIVVEKSREIYESIINEDAIEGLEDEVAADDEGAMDDGEFDGEEGGEFGDEDFGDEEGEEEFGDEEDGEFGDEEGEGDLEDRVVDLEDKLDELMAEFEAQMGGDDEGEEEFGDEEGSEEEFDDEGEEEFDDEEEGEEEDEDGLMESAKLKQVGGAGYGKAGNMGDDGAQKKSPGLQNPKRIDMGAKAVKFSGDSESVPSSAKKPSNYISKGEKTEDFGNINVPGGNAGKTGFKTKAPAPKKETIKAKSPVANESKTAKRRI